MMEIRQLVKSADELAELIAERIFRSQWDEQARNELARLLIEFAAEIKRSAIEP